MKWSPPFPLLRVQINNIVSSQLISWKETNDPEVRNPGDIANQLGAISSQHPFHSDFIAMKRIFFYGLWLVRKVVLP